MFSVNHSSLSEIEEMKNLNRILLNCLYHILKDGYIVEIYLFEQNTLINFSFI